MKAENRVMEGVLGEINKWLSDNKRSITWLSETTKVEYDALYYLLSGKAKKQIQQYRLDAINQALGTNFEK